MKRFLFLLYLPITEKQVIFILLTPLSQNSAIRKPQSKTNSLCFDCWKTESESNFALLIKLKKNLQKMKIFSSTQKIKAAYFPNYLWTGEKNPLMNFQGREKSEHVRKKKKHFALIGHWAILTQRRLDCGIQIYPIYWPLGHKNSLHTQHRASLQLPPSPYGNVPLRSSQLCCAALIGRFVREINKPPPCCNR